jgi:hypothetical protein
MRLRAPPMRKRSPAILQRDQVMPEASQTVTA